MGSPVAGVVLNSSAEFCSPEHVTTHRMPLVVDPSYESTYHEAHKGEFERLRNLVQIPQAGTFMHSDLTWTRQIRLKGRRSDSRTQAPVSVAYIPWARVQDFVKGEEARTDAPCKFVCQGISTNEQGKLMFPRLNSYSAIIRCACNMTSVIPFCILQCYNTYTCLWLGVNVSHVNHFFSPSGITASMDQMIMPRTYQWLQRICTRRNENSTRKENSFQVVRVTQGLALPRGCGDLANEGGANAVFL